VEGVQFGAYLLIQLTDERRGVQGFAERLVVLDSPVLEVGRQVIGRVAPPIRADDPDLLAPQLVPQRLEGAPS
jgi:hypothetical protein